MLTNKDIQKLQEIFVTKNEFKQEFSLLRTEFSLFRKDFSQLLNSVDSLARTMARHDDELIIINHRLHKLENSA